MKKIVPFNNILTFDTDVSSVTAISLEHVINKTTDTISGNFYISGEYKITDGQLGGEKFNFELPFDIALSNNYNMDTLVIDIDDFRYELIDRNNLKVNIDLFIEGDIIEDLIEEKEQFVPIIKENIGKDEIDEDEFINNLDNDLVDESDNLDDRNEDDNKNNDVIVESNIIDDNINKKIADNDNIQYKEDLINQIETNYDKEDKMEDIDINIDNNNVNENSNNNENNHNNENINSMFDGNNYPEKYVTYHVYRINEGDTIDKIIEKYHVNKEELMKYNNTVDIKIGDKLIIPANDK